MEIGWGGGHRKEKKERKIKEWDLLVMNFPGFETKLSNNCCNQDSCSFLKAKTVLCAIFLVKTFFRTIPFALDDLILVWKTYYFVNNIIRFSNL